MSQTAFQEFEKARSAQLQKNEARRMRTLVNQARGDVGRSGARWPFELTQNAHDPGTRSGLDEVAIDLSFDGHAVVYEHNGKPFSMKDLAALLSGGSNKEFESKDTTGRFGTGFLLTHVLSFQIDFHGVLAAEAGYEQVDLRLDRAGDEEQIYANTLSCSDAIKQGTSLAHLDGQPTARFTYATDKPEAASLGVSAFSKTLPYLYGTCQHLGQVLVRSPGETSHFHPGKAITSSFESALVRERQVVLTENGAASRTLKVVRITTQPGAASSLLVVLEQSPEGWRFLEPAPGFPRLFCRFPIRGSDFLPLNAVMDGRFDLMQERDSILMEEADKTQIAEALSLLPLFARLALQEHWQQGHKLARVGMPQLAFGDPLEDPLKTWWKTQLSITAKALADIPIVRTADGQFHRVTDPSPNADFVLPRFDLTQPADQLDFTDVWRTASELEDTLPPALDVAPDWTVIATEWMGLGITIQRLALTTLADFARDGATKLSGLKTKTAPLDWLVRFLNLVGKLSTKHNCAQILANILPNQNGALTSPHDLSRDAGVHDQLKDISANIKLNVRARLLLQELPTASAKSGFDALKTLLEAEIPQTLDTAAVIDECIDELSKQLPDTKSIPPAKQNFRDASVDLLKFLWNFQGSEAVPLAQRCPLIASDGSAVRWAPQRKIMAPISTWHKDAQPFAKLYKEDRILAEDYLSRFDGDATLVKALVAWGMAFSDPLSTESPKDLPGERVKAILDHGSNPEGLIITNVEFSQIALLPNEIIQRCQTDESLAKLLLGMVLNYIARNDQTWQQTKVVEGRRNKESVNITLTPALWIADLRSKAWVPVQDEQGTANVMANAGNLNKLLDPTWLADNNAAVALLTRFFGFNELELRLLATAPSPEARKELESGLAKLVEIVGANPADYGNLVTAIEMHKLRQKEKERNRKFGLAVQAAIEQYLKSQNLHLEFVDNGYDYDVFVDNIPTIEAGTHHFKLADYLLEVKATTSGEVRMTPTQALTASDNPGHFILCVVDLRGITHEQMEAEWAAADVEPKTRIVTSIGPLVNQPHGLVLQATQCQIGLRNDTSLRYGVPVDVWHAGIPIAAWIRQLKPQPISISRPDNTSL